jgi:hypothetical protein|tara:strand:+ start:64 stop:444 length:381 start_codon:yes stop_codon:yes gene_type:complete
MEYNNLIIAITEVVYVIYIMNFFKTKYSLAHPFTYFENKMLYHPIGSSSKPICNICKLGNVGAYFIAAYILFRFVIMLEYPIMQEYIKMMSIFVLLVVFILSFLNLNAVVYLIPYFVFEVLYIKNM